MKSRFATGKSWKHVLSLTGGIRQEREKLAAGLATRCAERGLRVLSVYQQNVTDFSKSLSVTAHCGGDCLFTAVPVEKMRDEEFIIAHATTFDSYDLVLSIPPASGDEEKDNIQANPLFDSEPVFIWPLGEDVAHVTERVLSWLAEQVMQQPVWGAVLIGGKSSRMGRPKHWIRDHRGVTWVERIVAQLDKVVDGVVLLGKGEVPERLHHLDRLPDISQARGPMAGIVAAMRWQPEISWVVVACDMPAISQEGLEWLLGSRIPGIWGTVPRHPNSGRLEPLLAYYDFRSRLLFENVLLHGELKPSLVCESDKMIMPELPQHLAGSWLNCNTPADLVALEQDNYHST